MANNVQWLVVADHGYSLLIVALALSRFRTQRSQKTAMALVTCNGFNSDGNTNGNNSNVDYNGNSNGNDDSTNNGCNTGHNGNTNCH